MLSPTLTDTNGEFILRECSVKLTKLKKFFIYHLINILVKCAKIPAWVKNPIGGRIVGANDARQPIPWQVLITNALKGEEKRSDFSIESTKLQCVNAPFAIINALVEATT